MTREEIFDKFVTMAKNDAQQAVISLVGFIGVQETLDFVHHVLTTKISEDLPNG